MDNGVHTLAGLLHLAVVIKVHPPAPIPGKPGKRGALSPPGGDQDREPGRGCQGPGDPSPQVPEPSGDQDFTRHRWWIPQSYGMEGSAGSRRSISPGSWGMVAQLATRAMVGPTPLNPFQIRGGIVTRR